MQTNWKIDVAMVDSIGDPLHNVMHSMEPTWLWDGIQMLHQCMMLKHSGLSGCPVELLWWWMGEGGLEVLLDAISQCPTSFSYVGFRTVDVGALEVIDDSSFLQVWDPCPWVLLVVFWKCWCPWNVLVSLWPYKSFWTFLLYPVCKGIQWWCSCFCCL